MICVDTSVWIASFRAPDSDAARRLRDLLDNLEVLLPLPVRFELLAGAGDQVRLRHNLSALPAAVPTAQTWRRMEAWLELAARAGGGTATSCWSRPPIATPSRLAARGPGVGRAVAERRSRATDVRWRSGHPQVAARCFGFADLLIASLAADHGASVWSLDRDFLRMARLGFVEPYPAQPLMP